jgi:hypothetical protein
VISYSSTGGKGEVVVGRECFYLWVWERELVYDLNISKGERISVKYVEELHE